MAVQASKSTTGTAFTNDLRNFRITLPPFLDFASCRFELTLRVLRTGEQLNSLLVRRLYQSPGSVLLWKTSTFGAAGKSGLTTRCRMPSCLTCAFRCNETLARSRARKFDLRLSPRLSAGGPLARRA